MRCAGCRKTYPPGALFCAYCGSRLVTMEAGPPSHDPAPQANTWAPPAWVGDGARSEALAQHPGKAVTLFFLSMVFSWIGLMCILAALNARSDGALILAWIVPTAGLVLMVVGVMLDPGSGLAIAAAILAVFALVVPLFVDVPDPDVGIYASRGLSDAGATFIAVAITGAVLIFAVFSVRAYLRVKPRRQYTGIRTRGGSREAARVSGMIAGTEPWVPMAPTAAIPAPAAGGTIQEPVPPDYEGVVSKIPAPSVGGPAGEPTTMDKVLAAPLTASVSAARKTADSVKRTRGPGLLGTAGGVLLVAISFMHWTVVASQGGRGSSGISLVRFGSHGGPFFYTDKGTFLFTGLWTLILGLVIISASVTVMLGWLPSISDRVKGAVILAAAVMAFLIVFFMMFPQPGALANDRTGLIYAVYACLMAGICGATLSSRTLMVKYRGLSKRRSTGQ